MAKENIARNDYSRAFLFKNGVYANEFAQYVAAMAVDALAQDRGDITPVRQPSEDNYGQFVDIGAIPGELSRMTTTLTGRMSRTELSTFYDLFKKACAFDLHLHFGLCQRPTDFTKYDKALVFEDVFVTSFGTDPLVALNSGDVAVIQETLDISIGNFYEIVPLKYSVRGASETDDGVIVDVTISDNSNCGGDCDNASTGWNKIFTATVDYISYISADGGLTWETVVIDGTPPEATVLGGIALGDYYVVLDSEGTLYYSLKKDLVENPGSATYAEVATDLTAPTAIASLRNYSILVEEGGVIWGMDAALTPEIIDNASATTEDLNAVAMHNDVSVAVGANGAVVYSFDNGVWYTATAVSTLNLISVAIKSRANWLVGSDNGQVWVTTDAGRTWKRVTFPNYTAVSDDVRAIEVSTPHVVWMAIGEKLYRSIDGGVTWTVQPDSVLAFPSNDELRAIGVTSLNPNFVVVGGDNGGAGILILGLGD